MSKKWYKSKTVWFNILTAALETTQLVSAYQVVPPGCIALATNLINIGLRTATKHAIHFTSPKE